MNTVYFASNGCAVLWHETERIAKYFRLNGWSKASVPADADIIIMTCCGVTHNEENQAIDMIRNLESERRTDSVFIISGCLPAFARERILDTAPTARLLTYNELPELDFIINASVLFKDVYFNIHSEIDEERCVLPLNSEERMLRSIDKAQGTQICMRQYDACTMRKYVWQSSDVYQIRVSYGCPGNCSYCATKLGIGNFCSVDKELVLRQFREGVAAGYQKFLLIGDEIGCYGSDFGENIIQLLNDVHAIDPDITVAIRYIHPDILVRYYEGLKSHFESGFVNYFCCAIQSASPVILRAMNRNPDIEPFIRCMEDINANGYPVSKHTQILVGFPGETDADVLQTLSCLMRCDFDHININKFSRRKGTKAYLMEDNIPEEIKVERCEIFRRWMMQNKKAKLYDSIKQAYSDEDMTVK